LRPSQIISCITIVAGSPIAFLAERKPLLTVA
jgi:hypothetical protein